MPALSCSRSRPASGPAAQGRRLERVHDATFAVGGGRGLPPARSCNAAFEDTGDDADPGARGYVELTNIADETINLHLVRFTDGIDFVFSDFELAPGGTFIWWSMTSTLGARYGPDLPIAGPALSGKLASGGETIELVDAVERSFTPFRLHGTTGAEADGGGFSLTMVDVTDPDPAVWSRKEARQPTRGRLAGRG